MSYHNLFERFTITLSDELPQLVKYTFGVVYNAFISSVLCGVVLGQKGGSLWRGSVCLVVLQLCSAEGKSYCNLSLLIIIYAWIQEAMKVLRYGRYCLAVLLFHLELLLQKHYLCGHETGSVVL